MFCGHSHAIFAQHVPMQRNTKRRSVDVGGLNLATGNGGQGKGWVGEEVATGYAELLSDMYNQTLNAVNEHTSSFEESMLSKRTRSRLIRLLDCWHFEPHKMPEDEVIGCTLLLFEALYRIEGMEETMSISPNQISTFIHHLRKIYRYENSYHNYEHALDVLQATQCYLVDAGLVPPVTILLEPGRIWKSARSPDDDSLINILRPRDVFAIYIAAIGHDVGHPGFTNVFMKNAQTPLSLVYDGISPLEQLHTQLLLRIMRHHGMGVLLDDPQNGAYFRKLLTQTVLATDMSVHKDFMRRLQEELDGKKADLPLRRILVSQALLKNADISNPTRPFPVAQHWVSALMLEWLSQQQLEEFLSMEQTVQSSDKPLGVSISQISFISLFTKPLLETTVKSVPEMARYAQHCEMNLDRWVMRKNALETSGEPTAQAAPPPTSPRQPSDFQSAFSLTLPQRSSLSTPTASLAASTASYDPTVVSPSESNGSFFSPISDPQFHNPFRSPTGSESSHSSGRGASVNGGNAPSPVNYMENEAIRTAGKLGVRATLKANRNSWCVTSTQFTPMSAASGPAASSLSPLASSPISASDLPHVSPPPAISPATAPCPSQPNGKPARVVNVAVPIAKKTLSEGAYNNGCLAAIPSAPLKAKGDSTSTA